MSHYQDQYYNNQLYQGEYIGGYQQEQSMRNYNPQMQESHYYSAPDVNTGTPANDDDNASVVSSVYSQPSVIGTSPTNYAQYYQGQSNTFEQRQQPIYDDDPMDYPPSPLAASTNTHNSVVGLTTQLPSYDQNEKNYTNYTEENQYNEFSPNSKSQFDVYSDFNNTYRKDESYDGEDTRNNTLIGTNGNSYAMNINSDNLSGTGKAIRHSTTGEHFVVSNKKNRRCAFCTRKICVIVTFVVLLLLGGGMYFVWPRVPKIEMFPPTAVGNAEITLNPSPSAKMQMDLQIELDNRDNWLPYKFKSFKVDVYNAERISSYNRPITSAEKKDFSISGRAKTTISVPISIDYSVSEKNDPIVQDFISACTKPPEGESRTPLNFRFDIKMFIAGLDWVFKPARSVPVSNFQCPFEAERPSPTDEPVPEQDVETKQPATDPPKDPTTPAPDPATDPAKEPTTDPAKEPATDPAKEPATDPATAPPQDPNAPAPDPAKEPATAPPQDPNAPAPDPATDPAKEPATDPATDPAKEPATDPATAPPQDPNAPAPDPAKEPATDPPQDPNAPAPDPATEPAT